FLQILEVNLFEKKPITSLVADALKQISDPQDDNQLNLFNC
ncbi:MAG TPA: IS4 family transposase, partial [Malonomonas sp.]